jgi:anti-sigma factor RsiW
MSCTYEQELTAYVDRELDDVNRKAIDAHLSVCARCRTSLALLQDAVGELAALSSPPLSPNLRRDILRRIDPPRRWVDRVRWLILRPAVWVPAGALTAALVAALALSTRVERATDAEEAIQLELAANLEDVEDLDVVGLEDPEDLEIVLHLPELEGRP